jgi:hypothetical protein
MAMADLVPFEWAGKPPYAWITVSDRPPPAPLRPGRVHGDAALQLNDLAAAPGGRTAVAAHEARPVHGALFGRPESFAALAGAACGDSVGIVKIAADD